MSKIKVAIDTHWTRSGIGAYFRALRPFFEENWDSIFIEGRGFLGDLSPDKKTLKLINSCDAFYTPYCSVPRGVRVPVFSTIHDVVFLDMRLSGLLGTLGRKWFYKRAVKVSRAIFTVSNFSKKRIEKHLAPMAPVVVTYNACAPDFSNLSTKSPLAKSEKDNKKNIDNPKTYGKNLLFVGNIKAHKGIKTLLEALESLEGARLTIVGSGDSLMTRDKTLGPLLKKLGERVTIENNASLGDLARLYCESDLLVQPSLYEGFGMPPLEALNSGCRVVMSDIEVFSEIYKDFPVTTFRAGDSGDLEKKIRLALKKDRPLLTPDQKALYSFSRTFSIIDETIKKMI